MDDLVRAWFRAHNSHGLVILHRVDDTQAVRAVQIEGYQTEIRDGMQHHQEFGFSSVPLPGARGVSLYQSGHRGAATIVTSTDPRYRPTGQKGGEVSVYMVDGAKADGTGGKTRAVLQGLLGWVAKLLGASIIIGDSSCTTITLTASQTVKIVGNLEITGDLKVDGKTTVQDINIQGAESGGGTG